MGWWWKTPCEHDIVEFEEVETDIVFLDEYNIDLSLAKKHTKNTYKVFTCKKCKFRKSECIESLSWLS